MGKSPVSKPISGDALKLDFSKGAFRWHERLGKWVPSEQKLPPEPGRVAPAESVPDDEILNKSSKNE